MVGKIIGQNLCILSKLIQTNTSCLMSHWQCFIQLRTLTMEWFIELYFELGLKYNEIWSMLKGVV